MKSVMDLANKYGQTELNMKDNGKIIKLMGKGNFDT